MKDFKTLTIILSIFFLTGCSNFSSNIFTQKPEIILQNKIERILNDSTFDQTNVGIKIISLNKGDILYERNSKKLFHPASNLKLLTAYTILENFGSETKIETKIFTDSIQNQTAFNLYLKGYGDPTFKKENLDSMVLELNRIGIKNIVGNIYCDISFFDENNWGIGWMWDDEPFYYAAYSSPLTIEQNSIFVTAFPNKEINSPPIIKLQPNTDFVKIVNNGKTTDATSKTNLTISRNSFDRNNTIIINGSINIKSDSVREQISIIEPYFYFSHLFKNSLLQNQIQFNGNIEIKNISSSAKLLVSHETLIDSIVVNFLKTSDNLSGENLLRFLSANKISEPGSTEKGIWLIKKSLDKIGIDSNSFRIDDGSGMSYYDLISPSNFIKLLTATFQNKNLFQRFFASLPIAGIDGTLSNRMKNGLAKNNLRAKTGTHSTFSSLSGFVKTKNGETLAFSMLMQHYLGGSSKFRKAQDEIGELMANFER